MHVDQALAGVMSGRLPDSDEAWQLPELQTALWFLAATTAEKTAYLPAPFRRVLFHGAEGDFTTGNPLYFMLSVCADACRNGADIDRWMDNDPTGSIGEQFSELEAILSQMLWRELRESELPFPDCVESYVHMRALLRATGRYAKAIIADLGWSMDVTRPRHSCEQLLGSYSYGGYSG